MQRQLLARQDGAVQLQYMDHARPLEHGVCLPSHAAAAAVATVAAVADAAAAYSEVRAS